jgi:hypothetical protein
VEFDAEEAAGMMDKKVLSNRVMSSLAGNVGI